jgi:RHS repeat-associated protein
LNCLAKGFEPYNQLSTTDWASGNRIIKYGHWDGATQGTGNFIPGYDANGSCIKKIEAVKDEADPETTFIEKTVYVYNLQNRLKEVNVTTDGVNWDVTTYLEEWTGGVLTKTYIIGDDVIGEADSSGTLKYYLYDGQGSVRHHSDTSGNLIAYSGCDTFAYDAYGCRVDPLKDTVNEGLFYTGEMYDSSAGMYYLRARYYNPLTGLFNRMDPFAGSNQDPQSLHKYLYCHANPINNIDPTGKLIGGTVDLVNTISIHAMALWMTYGGTVLTVLTKAVYVTAGIYAASSVALTMIEWGYLPHDIQGYIKAIQYYSGVAFVLSVVALGLLSTLPDPRVKPRPAQNVPRLARDKAVDGRSAPDLKSASRPVSSNPAINAEKNRDVLRLQQQGARQVRVDQRQIALRGDNFVQKGLNRPDTQGVFKKQPAVHIEYDTKLNNLLAHRDRILTNDPEALVVLKWFAPNGEYTIIP